MMKRQYFIKFGLLIINACLFISTYSYSSVIKGNTLSIYNKNPDKHFIVSKTKGYEKYYSSLKDIVWIEKQKDKTNHFCMIGYKWSDDTEEAIIFWKEMNSLHRWQPKTFHQDDISQLYSLRTAKFYYIHSLDNIPLSTSYLGSPTLILDDARRIIEDCHSYGEIITVEPIKISEICLKESICSDVFEASLAERDFHY